MHSDPYLPHDTPQLPATAGTRMANDDHYEIVVVQDAMFAIGGFRVGPKRPVELRIDVDAEGHHTVRRTDGKPTDGIELRHAAAIDVSVARLFSAWRRERTARLQATQRPTERIARTGRFITPHPDVIREEEWKRAEEQRRQAMLQQQVEASLQIQELRRQQTSRIRRPGLATDEGA